MLSVCLFLCLLTASYQLSIDEFVVPSWAEAGSDAELRCGFSLDASDGRAAPVVKWWYSPLYGAEERILLYQRIGDDNSEGAFLRENVVLSDKDDILLRNVKYTHSGRYECEVSGYNEKRVHADLIVFSKGSGPELNITLVEDGPDDDSEQDLMLECRADDVTPQPELSIDVNGRPLEGVKQYESSSGEGLYSVVANVTVSKADLAEVQVRCELFFENKNITHLPYADFATFSTGTELPADVEEHPPENNTMANNDPEPQINRSSCRIMSWWLYITAVLVPFQLCTLM